MNRNNAWIVTVPLIVLLGLASGWVSNSGYGNPWFDGLRKPSFMPPGWTFGAVWTILYILMGGAVAQIIASDSPAKRPALLLFAIQLALNLLWSPVFFGLHQMRAGLAIIAVLTLLAAMTVLVFRRVRPLAAILLLPYVAWLLFATVLNLAIVQLNG